MFTVEQCLAKALELEQRRGEGLPPGIRDDYRQLALQWRRLAERARIQDRRMTGTG
jgi:ribosomal protein S18